MPFTLTMPKLSPTMEEGTITKWRKKEGEYVEAEEVLIEVATDKATVEYAPLDGGWLRKIVIPAGSNAAVNETIAIFTEKKDESIEGFEKPTPPKVEAAALAPKAAATAPKIVQREHPIFPLETPIVVSLEMEERVKASPLAKKLAKEKKLDLASVRGSGPKGMVQASDLEAAQKDTAAAFGSRKPTLPSGTYEEEHLTPMRKAIAERMAAVKSFVPHFYVGVNVDCTALQVQREQLKAMEIKVSINDMIIKAAALALREHPDINSGFNMANHSIVRFKTIDIAVAVTVEGGLITPLIRHADFKNLGQISAEMKHLAEKARVGKLQPQEYRGGSFTISNLGMYGIDTFTAIINAPQAAILAVGGIHERAIVRDGVVVPGQEMTLTLSADHRVLDGAQVAQFLKTLQRILENPSVLLVH